MWIMDMWSCFTQFIPDYFLGQIQEEEFPISRTATVGDILTDLRERFPGNYASLNNAVTELQEDDLIDDVFEEEDVFTAVEQKDDEVRFVGKKFKNCSDDLVILMDKKKRPFFLEKKDEHCLQMRALDFFPTVVVFRSGGRGGEISKPQSCLFIGNKTRKYMEKGSSKDRSTRYPR